MAATPTRPAALATTAALETTIADATEEIQRVKEQLQSTTAEVAGLLRDTCRRATSAMARVERRAGAVPLTRASR